MNFTSKIYFQISKTAEKKLHFCTLFNDCVKKLFSIEFWPALQQTLGLFPQITFFLCLLLLDSLTFSSCFTNRHFWSHISKYPSIALPNSSFHIRVSSMSRSMNILATHPFGLFRGVGCHRLGNYQRLWTTTLTERCRWQVTYILYTYWIDV